jgi:hypothetical protein
MLARKLMGAGGAAAPEVPVLVQSKTTRTDGQDIANIAAVFDSTPTENNVIIACYVGRTYLPSYSLSAPSGFTAAIETAYSFSNTTFEQFIFYKTAGAAESATVTLTLGNDGGAGDHGTFLHIMEWSGMATSSTFDVSASTDGTGSNSLSVSTNTTAATAVGNSVAIALAQFADDDFDTIVDGDWTNSFEVEYQAAWTTTLPCTNCVGKKILSSTGTQESTLTLAGGGTEQRSALIAVFKGV